MIVHIKKRKRRNRKSAEIDQLVEMILLPVKNSKKILMISIKKRKNIDTDHLPHRMKNEIAEDRHQVQGKETREGIKRTDFGIPKSEREVEETSMESDTEMTQIDYHLHHIRHIS